MNLFSEDVRRNPLPVYDRLRSTSPVFQVPQTNLWMIFMDPPRHSKLRALISQAFTLASAEPWEPGKALHVHGPVRLPVRFEPSK